MDRHELCITNILFDAIKSTNPDVMWEIEKNYYDGKTILFSFSIQCNENKVSDVFSVSHAKDMSEYAKNIAEE